ncbi:hypothetical protein BG015_005411 [Linnemannia schmuckeri]|uniref:O-fucosyltransferase family protein n=1 Tax=Linnemannia schmuckeri TaxID=64567 RepID=A0A9P5R7S9_9FUNG|nr:hypothetical protein BG015_005411 [Linnemannia schmuckeri]
MAATPAVNNLNANTKYLSFLPFGGLTNQFISVQNAAFIALKLNRTLILPPIISNSHDRKNTHQRWSRYMGLPRFMQLTGLQVLEWDDVRPMTDAQRQVGLDQGLRSTTIKGPLGPIHTETEEWAAIAENTTCQIIHGYGRPELDINFSARNFLFHFLIRPVFVFAPAPPRKQDKPNAPIVYDNRDSGDVVLVEDILDRYSDYDISPKERAQGKPNLLFLSHTFGVKLAARTGDDWNLIGKNLHFQPKVMEYATLRINQEIQDDKDIEVLPNNDPEEVEITEDERRNPVSEEGTTITDIQAPSTRIPHIAVHLRRDDIWHKCVGAKKGMNNCMIPIERYADAVERARVYASRTLGLHSHLPVVVTTDTQSEEDFQKIKELGWHRLNHSKYQTTEIWGTFGDALVDAAILAHADVLVGSAVSTMSRIAVLRQKGWYDRRSFFPTVEHPKEERRVMMKRRLEDEGEIIVV